MNLRWLVIGCGIAFGGTTVGFCHEDDSEITRYFDQLRRRGFYSLAEHYAESRLADPQLSPERRIELVIELSRTLAAHALSAAEDQQPELWTKAAAVLTEELSVAADSPRRIVLEVYEALVPIARTEQLVWDLEAAPFDEPQREALDRISQTSLGKSSEVERSLTERIRALDGKKKPPPGVTAHELRRLSAHLRLKTGLVRQARARLSPPGSQERHAELIDADERFRKLANSGSEEWQPAAKLGLAVSNRLRDEHERALDMLDALERENKSAGTEFLDAIRIEKARVLLHVRQPDLAAEILLKLRTGRERLPGEYWLTYFQTLSAMRRTAAQKQAGTLAAELNASAEAALKEVDQQAGGSWSRRCRAVWASAENVERYGQRLAALISRGKSEYLSGRIEAAVTAYASALELAQEDGKTDLEMEVGYTLAAILAKESRWDDVAHRCRQLVTAHPDHAQSAQIDLLGLHALAVLYDQQRSPERSAAYEQALADHLSRFPHAATAPEVEFLQGQLFETAGRIPAAIAAYRRVKPDHARGPVATAAAARGSVARLLQQRETGERDPALEQQSLEIVTPALAALPDAAANWSDPQIELAYHGVRVFLLIEPPRFPEAERRLNQLEDAIRVAGAEANRTGLRVEIGRRTGPLRIIALAGQGRPQEAERLLGTLEQAGSTELLAVVEELGQIDLPSPASARLSLSEMQLAAAETLSRRRKELTPAQQRRLDLALAKSYLATAQPVKATDIYRRLLEADPPDVELARRLGRMLGAREELACRVLARDCWQSVERSCKQGTPEWLAARAEVIESCLRVGDKDQARKLFAVTKLLYPKLGDAALRERYAELESQTK